MASSSPCACQFLLLLLNFIVLGVQGQYYQQPPYQQPGYNQYNQQSVCNTQPGYNNQPPMQNYQAQPVGGCPRGWEADGQCTFGNCITPTQLCQKTYNVCCRVSTTQAVQSCQQNPKTSACELTWCPMGAYRDGGCSKMGMCMDPSEKCVNGDCCEKSYLPTGMEPNPCSSSAPINTNPGYGQPMYNPSTYGNQQIIGYTADGRPVYAASPMTNYGAAQPMSYTNPASSAYPYAGSPVAAPIVYYPTYSYSAPYTAPGTQPGYSAPYTAPGTQPGYPSPYTNTGYGNPTSAYDPAALQQACAGGDQSTCATQVQANPSVCQQGGQQIVMSCPRACNLCSGVSYGRKK